MAFGWEILLEYKQDICPRFGENPMLQAEPTEQQEKCVDFRTVFADYHRNSPLIFFKGKRLNSPKQIFTMNKISDIRLFLSREH